MAISLNNKTNKDVTMLQIITNQEESILKYEYNVSRQIKRVTKADGSVAEHYVLTGSFPLALSSLYNVQENTIYIYDAGGSFIITSAIPTEHKYTSIKLQRTGKTKTGNQFTIPKTVGDAFSEIDFSKMNLLVNLRKKEVYSGVYGEIKLVLS